MRRIQASINIGRIAGDAQTEILSAWPCLSLEAGVWRKEKLKMEGLSCSFALVEESVLKGHTSVCSERSEEQRLERESTFGGSRSKM